VKPGRFNDFHGLSRILVGNRLNRFIPVLFFGLLPSQSSRFALMHGQFPSRGSMPQGGLPTG
jgi:hypothetical protein